MADILALIRTILKTNMKKGFSYFIALLAGTAFAPVSASAKVHLQNFITDSMVVQQQSLWKISGRSEGGKVTVTASWDNTPATVYANEDGSFCAELRTPKAGGPFTVTFDDGEATVLRDIYSGEVWLCSGQSNMEMPVEGWGKVQNYKQEVANARHPEIRFLQIKKQTAYSPQPDTEVNMGGWRTCTPSTVADFSAIAYFYAREMSKRLGVHVGVIDCTWGGTPAEAWTSFEGVCSVEGFETETSMLKASGFDKDRIKADYDKMIDEMVRPALTAGDGTGGSAYSTGQPDKRALPAMSVPGAWENSVLPGLDGIVLLQREITIPAEWEGKPLTLRLGAIDDEDITYFNGVRIGSGSGWNVARTYTVPGNMVKAGKSVISIRVTDYGDGGGIYCSPDELRAEQDSAAITLAGEWSYKVLADFAKLPKKPVSPESSGYPTVLYNAMLHPLHTLPIKGVLWYQGCANVGRARQYSTLFRQLINDWRSLWQNEELPFYFVQLAGYLKQQAIQPESEWAALRQAQADALQLRNTGMAVAIDIGDQNDIHPKNKQEAARRLALIALKNTYGCKDIIDKAPALKSCKMNGNKAVLAFDSSIVVDGESPQGFIVLADDGKWTMPDKVETSGKKIKIEANTGIKAIKYNWADYPNGNLKGTTCLPVAQFSIGE